jgi:hypothetical protein
MVQRLIVGQLKDSNAPELRPQACLLDFAPVDGEEWMSKGNWWEAANDDERLELVLRAIDMAESFQRRVNADLKALQAVHAVLSSIGRETKRGDVAEARRLAEAGLRLLDGLIGIENAHFDFAEMRAMIAAKDGWQCG